MVDESFVPATQCIILKIVEQNNNAPSEIISHYCAPYMLVVLLKFNNKVIENHPLSPLPLLFRPLPTFFSLVTDLISIEFDRGHQKRYFDMESIRTHYSLHGILLNVTPILL